jgi:hypothetical protein
MKWLGSRGLLVCTLLAALAVTLPAAALAGAKFTRVASIPGTGARGPGVQLADHPPAVR